MARVRVFLHNCLGDRTVFGEIVPQLICTKTHNTCHTFTRTTFLIQNSHSNWNIFSTFLSINYTDQHHKNQLYQHSSHSYSNYAAYSAPQNTCHTIFCICHVSFHMSCHLDSHPSKYRTLPLFIPPCFFPIFGVKKRVCENRQQYKDI